LAVGTGQPTPSRMLREPPRPAWERLLGLRASKEWSARFGTLERARQPMIFLGGLPIGARAVKRRCENMPAIEVERDGFEGSSPDDGIGQLSLTRAYARARGNVGSGSVCYHWAQVHGRISAKKPMKSTRGRFLPHFLYNRGGEREDRAQMTPEQEKLAARQQDRVGTANSIFEMRRRGALGRK
jgi:hypothetical protein